MLAFGNLDNYDASSLVTRMTTDITVIQNAIGNGFRPLVRGPVTLVVGLIYALALSRPLATVFAIILPVLAIVLGVIAYRGARSTASSRPRWTTSTVWCRKTSPLCAPSRRTCAPSTRRPSSTPSIPSSLVQLIARLYDATEGAVLMGGCDVRDYDLVALRDAVGIVLQKNVLFTGTVRENLQWGAPDATDEELLRACRAACVDEFLDRIGGLDGELGQGGAGVSGGQKQRLCIARTLLKHPRVLIFDDSTSAVDMATDAKIREHIAQIPDITVIIIAQRIASVMDADRIVVLDDGRVHGVGTHEELLADDNIYQEIYASQMEFAGDASDAGDADDADDPFSSVPGGSSLKGDERHA